MSRFLLNSYDVFTEIALWLLFAGAVIAGYSVAGVGGVIGFVVGAFIISVFLVAPFIMISDIRKTVARIEVQRAQNATSSSTTSARVGSIEGFSADASSSATDKSTGPIKNYKGYELTRGDDGVYVDGNKFPNVLEAEAWVNGQVKA